MLWRLGVRRCFRCGGELPGPNQSTLEHIVPRSKGAQTTRANLSLSHEQCNRSGGRELWLGGAHRDVTNPRYPWTPDQFEVANNDLKFA